MKNIKIICGILLLAVVAFSCKKIEGIDQDLSFVNTIGSVNPSTTIDISNDNSGVVKITPLGDGVVSYTVHFGHGTGAAASAVVAPGLSVSHIYPEGSYTITIDATDIAGVLTTNTYPITVTYRAPENLKVTISGDMVISAEAMYAKSFMVYYGDVANETGTPLDVDASLPAHIYPEGGPYTLKVIALSGGAATSQFTKLLPGLPMTFENPSQVDSVTITGTGQAFDVMANPFSGGLNTSAMVGKFTRGKEGASSVKYLLDVPINFAYGMKIKVLVYNTDALYTGKKMNVELGSAAGGKPADGVAVSKVAVTTSGAWEELTFDFSTIAGVTSATRFNSILFRFSTTQIIPGAVIYIDNVRLTN